MHIQLVRIAMKKYIFNKYAIWNAEMRHATIVIDSNRLCLFGGNCNHDQVFQKLTDCNHT